MEERTDTQRGILVLRAQVPYAFKDWMIRGVLQFALRIAFRCVLHRCENQDIHCVELYVVSYAQDGVSRSEIRIGFDSEI